MANPEPEVVDSDPEVISDSDGDVPPIVNNNSHTFKPPLRSDAPTGSAPPRSAPPPRPAFATAKVPPKPAIAKAPIAKGMGRGRGGFSAAAARDAAKASAPQKPPPPADGDSQSDSDADSAVAASKPTPPRTIGKAPFPTEARNAKMSMAKGARGGGHEEAAAVLAMAKVQIESGKYAEAMESAKAAAELCRDGGDLEGDAEALRIVVKAHLEDEKIDEALRLVQTWQSENCDPRKAGDKDQTGTRKAAAIVKLAEADVYSFMERPKMAEKAGREAVDSFRSLNDNAMEGTALIALANVYLKQGTAFAFKNALTNAQEALEVWRRLEDQKEEAGAMLVIAKAHLNRVDYEQAHDMASKSLELAQSIGNKGSEAAAHREVAMVLQQVGEDENIVLQMLMEAVELYEEISDPLGAILTRHLISNVYQSSGRFEEALPTMEAALSVARDLKDRVQIGLALEQIKQLHESGDTAEKALSVMKEEHLLAKASGDPWRELAALKLIAMLQLTLDQSAEVMHTVEETRELVMTCGDKRLEGQGFLFLADVHRECKQYDEAMDAASRAQQMVQAAGCIRAEAEVLQLLIDLHLDMGNEEDALKMRIELRMHYKAVGWKHEEADAYLNEASILMEMQGFKEASKKMKEAIAIFDHIGDKQGEAMALLNQSTLNLACKKATDALRSTVQARKGFQAIGDFSGEARALVQASQVYLSNGTPEEALRVAKEARSLCKEEKEKRGEAEALQNVTSILVDQVTQNAEKSKQSKEETMTEAIEATKELVQLWSDLQDDPGQVSALLNLSSLYSLNKDGEKAVDAAEEALELAAKFGDDQEAGSALLQLSEAYLELRNFEQAESRADEAKQIFESIQHDIGVEAANQLIEAAKNPPPAEPDEKKPAKAKDGIGAAGSGERNIFPVNSGLKKLDGKATDTKKAAPPGGRGAKPSAAAPENRQELLKAGNFAVLQNLKARPDLNGHWGILVKYHEAKQRWQVRIEGAEDMMVRIENIQAKTFDEYEQEQRANDHALFQQGKDGAAGEAPAWGGKAAGRGAAEDQAKKPHGRGGRQLFSQMSKALDEQQPGRKGGKFSGGGDDDSEVEDVVPSAPDQERRRQQLNAAMNEPPKMPSFVSSSKEVPLKNVLRAVRPDWTNSELYAVQAKLRKIQIEDPETLFHILRTQGEKAINLKLKAAGEKGMKMDTLEALHHYGDKME